MNLFLYDLDTKFIQVTIRTQRMDSHVIWHGDWTKTLRASAKDDRKGKDLKGRVINFFFNTDSEVFNRLYHKNKLNLKK